MSVDGAWHRRGNGEATTTARYLPRRCNSLHALEKYKELKSTVIR